MILPFISLQAAKMPIAIGCSAETTRKQIRR
jgi:hypothetical protein